MNADTTRQEWADMPQEVRDYYLRRTVCAIPDTRGHHCNICNGANRFMHDPSRCSCDPVGT